MVANGIAAAFGKAGALLGLLLAGYVGLEISNLMACFGAVALMGVGSTLLIIQAHFPKQASPRSGVTSSVVEWCVQSCQCKMPIY